MQTFWFPWCLSPGSDTSSRRAVSEDRRVVLVSFWSSFPGQNRHSFPSKNVVEELQPLCWGSLGRCWERCVISCQALLSKTEMAKGLSAPSGSYCWQKPGGADLRSCWSPQPHWALSSGQSCLPFSCLHLALISSYLHLTLTSYFIQLPAFPERRAHC